MDLLLLILAAIVGPFYLGGAVSIAVSMVYTSVLSARRQDTKRRGGDA